MKKFIVLLLAFICCSCASKAGIIWDVVQVKDLGQLNSNIGVHYTIQDCGADGATVRCVLMEGNPRKANFIEFLSYTLKETQALPNAKSAILNAAMIDKVQESRNTSCVFNIPKADLSKTFFVVKYADGEKDGMSVCKFVCIWYNDLLVASFSRQ